MKDLFETPNIYVQSIDWDTNQAVVAPMNRATYAQTSFLDHRTISTSKPKTIGLDVFFRTFDRVQPPTRRLNFIFHTAFCGSTLLSRCLDHPGACLAYKEPFILHQLASNRRQGPVASRRKERDAFLNVAIALLSRTYSPQEIPLIKPSDSSINLARDLLRQHPDSVALLLYMRLKQFVVSMLKTPSRRQFLRSQIHRAQHDLRASGFGEIDATRLNDAEATGLVWLGLMVSYLDLLGDMDLNVRSLDASLFHKYPEQVLNAAASLFDLSIEAETFTSVVEEGVFRRDAKFTDLMFDRANYELETKRHQQRLDSEIREAETWVDQMTRCRPLPPDLPRPLLPRR
jgi:hypothetical protein